MHTRTLVLGFIGFKLLSAAPTPNKYIARIESRDAEANAQNGHYPYTNCHPNKRDPDDIALVAAREDKVGTLDSTFQRQPYSRDILQIEPRVEKRYSSNSEDPWCPSAPCKHNKRDVDAVIQVAARENSIDARSPQIPDPTIQHQPYSRDVSPDEARHANAIEERHPKQSHIPHNPGCTGPNCGHHKRNIEDVIQVAAREDNIDARSPQIPDSTIQHQPYSRDISHVQARDAHAIEERHPMQTPPPGCSGPECTHHKRNIEGTTQVTAHGDRMEARSSELSVATLQHQLDSRDIAPGEARNAKAEKRWPEQNGGHIPYCPDCCPGPGCKNNHRNLEDVGQVAANDVVDRIELRRSARSGPVIQHQPYSRGISLVEARDADAKAESEWTKQKRADVPPWCTGVECQHHGRGLDDVSKVDLVNDNIRDATREDRVPVDLRRSDTSDPKSRSPGHVTT